MRFSAIATDPNGQAMRWGSAPAERLLIWSLRAWAVARDECAGEHQVVARILSQKTSKRAGALFAAWVQAVEASSARPIEVDCPGCGGPGLDVQRLVVACGIAPVDLPLAIRLLEPLVSDAEAVAILARCLNAALAADGWLLPARINCLEGLQGLSRSIN